MIVKHNLTAMNSNRMLGITTGSQAKATEKLSSGYKINRAADDAAGLAISEKMRKQIRGLTQASLNAQDGISAVQTADGALNEVHDMIQRLTELSVKAANGTLSKSDRQAVQDEVNQLVTEIDRVSTTTKFNETYLLRGTSAGGSVGVLTYDGAKSALDAEFAGITPAPAPVLNAETGTMGVPVSTLDDFQTAPNPVDAGNSIKGKTVGPIGSPAPGTTYVLVDSVHNTNGTGTISVREAIDKLNAKPNVKAFASMNELTSALKEAYGENIRAISSYLNEDKELMLRIETFADINNALDLSLHVGTDSADDNKIYMNIAQLSARGLGLNGLKVSGDSHEDATAAIDVVASALQRVSAQRSALGAIQNRLEHTIANLDNIVENTTSAEAAIRDTDMATQMVEYSNNNILAQAGQAMLAQANQSTSGVLSLLQ